ncbi:alanine dehydrogenase [Desulfobaculum sp. SPO524]|uniref:alanine dehydrogenase n=1 Tax=Desulfobaculum sp. SPO524 TaxID=3378071 RepID=UPI0038555732
MIIGVPKEIKTLENRVALTPGGAQTLIKRGHEVLVERGAGLGSGITDDEYTAKGARIVSRDEAWHTDIVVKVKEPIEEEYHLLRDDLILFTYLHLAADRPLTSALMESGCTSIAYETVQLPDRSLPLLMPMSEVAGRMATQVGVHYLEKTHGGRGILIGGVPGVTPGAVVILGAGIVGTNAAKMALGLGAQVTIIDINHHRLTYMDDVFGGRLITTTSTEHNIRRAVRYADLLIGAVLIPGAKAPNLVTANMIKTMKPGAVVVDVAIDQGGCIETIKPTTHADPIYEVDGVVHYGVTNMPGAVPRTSTFALTNQTIHYLLKLADNGLDALRDDPALMKGLNTFQGALTCPAVGEAFNLPTKTPEELL